MYGLELTVQFYHGDVVVQVARMEFRMIAGKLKMDIIYGLLRLELLKCPNQLLLQWQTW